MLANPKFSVVIPTFNRVRQVKAAIESVLSQTYSELEVIVADDGSVDGTAKFIADSYGGNKRVQYFFQENQGKSIALNNGLLRANGEWISFLDSDDVWLPKKLEWQVRAINKYNGEPGVCFTDARFINNPCMNFTAFQRAQKTYSEQIGLIKDPIEFALNPPHGVFMQTIVVRAKEMQEVGGFDSKLRLGEDSDFIFRLALKGSLCYVNLPLVQIDRSTDRDDSLMDHSVRDEYFRISQRQYLFEKWLAMVQHEGLERRGNLLDLLQETYNDWANWYLRNGDFSKSLAYLSRALGVHWNSSLAVKWFLVRCLPALSKKIILGRIERRTRQAPQTSAQPPSPTGEQQGNR